MLRLSHVTNMPKPPYDIHVPPPLTLSDQNQDAVQSVQSFLQALHILCDRDFSLKRTFSESPSVSTSPHPCIK